MANTVKQLLEKDMRIEPLDYADWAKRIGRIRAIRGWVAENLNLAHDRQAKLWNGKHRPLVYELGDKVLSRNHVLSNAFKNINAKLIPKYRGPLIISKILSPLVYEISNENGKVISRVAVTDLKPYKERC